MEKSKTCDRDLVTSPYCARSVARQGLLCIAVMLTMALLTSCTFWGLSGNTAEPMVIVVSNDAPAFSQVAREITHRYPIRTEVLLVGDSDAAHARTLKRLQESEARLVVAIGLPAALAARTLTGKRVIFCQVFHYEDNNLVTPWMKGVSAMPSLSEQFRAWKSLAPDLRRVAVLTGPGLQGLLQESRSAASAYQIDLLHVPVRSDKETLFAYKRIASQVQGLWLVPDNRILSSETIRELLAHSVREGKQVSAPNPELLAFGALLSASSDYGDIAERVVARARQSWGRSELPGPAIEPLQRAQINVSARMLEQFNLRLPPALRGRLYAP
jgi:putative tryptophan/tyrosine transport system substrate-binding protein